MAATVPTFVPSVRWDITDICLSRGAPARHDAVLGMAECQARSSHRGAFDQADRPGPGLKAKGGSDSPAGGLDADDHTAPLPAAHATPARLATNQLISWHSCGCRAAVPRHCGLDATLSAIAWGVAVQVEPWDYVSFEVGYLGTSSADLVSTSVEAIGRLTPFRGDLRPNLFAGRVAALP
jgi:hypothetical protein